MDQVMTDIIDVSEATFEAEVVDRSRQTPVVVDFWAPWCGPCRMLGPILERLARDAHGAFRLAKLNVDDNQGLAVRYNVSGIPAVKAFRGGKVVAEFVGAQPESKVREFLKGLTPSEADRGLTEANRLLAAQRWAEAEAAYRKVRTGNGKEPAAALGLAKALFAQGKRTDAQRALAEITGGAELATAEKLRPLALLLAEAQAGDDGGGSELDIMYRRAGRLLAEGNPVGALDGLLALLRRDKRYRQGEARLAMLGLFELVGDDSPLTRDYRNRLASVLY